MASSSVLTQDNRVGRLHTPLGKDALLLLRMTCVERLSEPFSIIVDAVADRPQPIHKLLGANLKVEFDSNNVDYVNRWFNGDLWEYVELEHDRQGYHYRLTLRPTVSFQSLNQNNRIFQKISVPEIVKSVLVGNLEFQLKHHYGDVEYCVQYQESEFAFVSRLLEREGIYYYFVHDGESHKMVFVDDRNIHLPGDPKVVAVRPRSDNIMDAAIWSVSERRSVGVIHTAVQDYDFETPSKTLLKTSAAADKTGRPTPRRGQDEVGAGGSWAQSAEMYHFPAGFNTPSASLGERYAHVRLDGYRRQMARSFALGSPFAAAVGNTISLVYATRPGGMDGPQNVSVTVDYLIVGTTHRYSASSYTSADDGNEDYSVELELMPSEDQYRPAQRTPLPRVHGPHTALVVGPAGEEIYTDDYGRIRVQFPWDRRGKRDEKSSCFIRVMHATAGKNWGAFTVPRIGQEVIVEFLDGDPDRPICTGAVYNGENKPPEKVPDNQTQSGFKSRSTKGGGGYNRWWIEDKKGSEVVWFRAERDYRAHIVNGGEWRDIDSGDRTTTLSKGNEHLTIKEGSRFETIEEGDDNLFVKSGKRDVTINDDDVLTVESGHHYRIIKNGKEDVDIQAGNRIVAIQRGDDSLTINQGNRTTTLDMGNRTTTLEMGKDSTETMQGIELKCGESSIVIDQSGVTIKGMVVSIEGTMSLATKAPNASHAGNVMMMIQGAVVMIN